jgi:uncharacterized membrane-anchored protein YhcB (DUF1043 family)
MPFTAETAPFAAVAILVAGLFVGALAARLVLPSRSQLRRLMADLEKLRAEHEAYRLNVTHHFETTSELVANMTASYKAVYDHLATGARSLCEPTKALQATEFGAPRLVFEDRFDVGAADAPPKAPALDPSKSPARESKRYDEEQRTPSEAKTSDVKSEAPILDMTKRADDGESEASESTAESIEDRARDALH